MLNHMRSLALAASKGGVGKTTLSLHLAVTAALAGERVLVLDADAQRSCVAWANLRDRDHPRVEGIEPLDVTARLDRAGAEGYTVCIVDTAPRASGSLTALLRAIQYVLVPLRPSALDLAALEQSLAIVAAADKPGAIVLNACPARAPEIPEARYELLGLDLPLAPDVGERRSYGRAIASGQAVVEFEPTGAAASEMSALWQYVAKGML